MKKNKQIECLRGISIFLIMIYHIFCRFSQIYLQSDIKAINWIGDFASMIFMVLSAYFLGKSLNSFSLIVFYKKKFMRLWPIYVISITITFIITTTYQLPERTCSFREYVLNLFFINGYMNIPYVESAHWYMTSLLSFIIVVGILHKFKVFNFPLAFIGWIVLAVGFKIAGQNMVYKILGGPYIGVACIGIVLYKLLNNNEQYEPKRKSIEWYSVLIIALGYTMGTKGWYYVLYIVLIIPVISFSVFGKLTLLEKTKFNYLGNISYPLYLVHQNIAFVIELIFIDIFGPYTVWYGIIALITVTGIGILMYIIESKIEQKIILLTGRNE